jgi:DNA-binding response OmpR family regulator
VEHCGKILIVDDEPAGRDTLEALLTGRGYELFFAGDGREALVQARRAAPDVILLDVMMPGLDGFEVCRQLRGDPLLAEVPVIMVTALDDRASRLEGIEAGADDFVTKPYDRVELRARVRTITRLNRYRRLLAERSRFQWVVEQAGDGYLMLDGDGRATYANAQARLYLDLPPASPGQGALGHFPDLAWQRYSCEPRDAWSAWPDPPPGCPLYLVCPESAQAKAVWLQVDALALPSGPDRLVRLSDVTDEVAMQRDLRGFHDVIRHKVRTPLMSMLSSLELLVSLGAKMSPEDVADLAGSALRGTVRLRDTVEDVLAYLDAPALAQPGQTFALAEIGPLVDQVAAHLGIQSVRVYCAKQLAGAHLPLSARAVELALTELLENARKFHPVEAPAVDVAVLDGDGGKAARLCVADDGVALSPEHLQHVWSPYYQGEKHFTGEARGTGLGLPTVAALVWGIGGRCQVRNRTDRDGLVVELTLPLAPPDLP